MFTNQDLKKLIVPLFLEQLLVALVGIADVFVIGFVGEAAVSGVSLVNAFNMILSICSQRWRPAVRWLSVSISERRIKSRREQRHPSF
ncbi:MATE family efflux transporter [Fusicatenibacter sp.]